MKKHLHNIRFKQLFLSLFLFVCSVSYSNAQDMVVAQTTVSDATSPLIGGSANQVVLGFRVTRTNVNTATNFNSLVVNTTTDPNSVFSSVALYKNTSNTFSGATIIAAATATLNPTNITFATTTYQAYASGAGDTDVPYYFFVVGTVKSTVTTTAAGVPKIQLAFSQANVGFSALTAAAFSITGTDYNFQALEVSIASRNGGANNVAASPLVAGTTGRAVFGFSLVSNGSQTVSAINVQLTSDPTGKLSTWSLVRSTDNDFATGGNNTTIAGGINFAPSATEVVITGLTEAITTATATNYFLVADVDPAATGATPNIQASISSANVTTTTGFVTGSTVTGIDYAFATLTTTIGSLNAGANNVSASPIIAGATGRAVFGFSLTSNGSQTVTAINVQLTSDPAGKLGTWSLVRSTDTDFATGGNNTTIAGGINFAPSATEVVITGLAEAITTATTTNYFLVANVDPAVTGATASIQASLGSSNVTASTGTVTGSTATGIDYSFQGVITTIASLNAGANNVAASPLVAGATGKAVFGFSLTSNGSQTVTAINVQLTSDPSGKLGTWSLVRSTDADFNSAGDNTTVAGGITFTPSATQVAITVLSEAITTTTKNYFLVANVDPAVTGATASIQASLGSSNVTASTGTVTGSTATGLNYTFAPLTTTIGSLNAGANNVAASPLIGGTTGRAVFGFSLTSNGSQTVTAVNVQLSSTPIGKLGTWSLVRSTDADFASAGDNTTIAGGITFTPSATQVAITVLSEAITTTTKNYFLVATVDPGVTSATATIQASLGSTNVTASTGSVTSSATGVNYSFNSSQNSTITLNGGTTTAIDYDAYLSDGNISSTTDSENLATFRLRDPANDSDNLNTVLTGLTITLANFENVERITIMVGDATSTTEATGTLVEQAVTNDTIYFTGLSIQADENGGSNGDVNFTIRVSFKTDVDDNEVLLVTIIDAQTATASSRLTSFAASSTNNDIEVSDTKLVFIPGTVSANVNQQFSITVEAQDDNGNVDLDENAETVTLTISGGPTSTLSTGSQSLTETLTNGTFTWTQLSIASSDPSYTLTGADGAGGDDNLSNATGFITINSLGVSVTNGVSTETDSLDLCYGGDYQLFGTIEIEESDAGGFSTGSNVTYSIQLPYGFEFNPSVTTAPSTAGADITAMSTLSYSSGNTVVEFTYSVGGTANINTISITGLSIRYILDVAPTDSLILRKGGTAVQAGNSVSDAIVHGKLTAYETSNNGFTFRVSSLPGQPPVQSNETNFSNTVPAIILSEDPANPAATTSHEFSGNGVAWSQVQNSYTFSPAGVGIGNNYLVKYDGFLSTGCKVTVTKIFSVYATSVDGLLAEYCSNDTTEIALSVNPNKYDIVQYYPDWSPTTSYYQGSGVKYGGKAYYSLQTSNLGNQPDISITFWKERGYVLESSNEYSVYIPSYKRIESVRNENGSVLTLTVASHGYTNGSIQHLYAYVYDANWNYLYTVTEGDYAISNVTANTFQINFSTIVGIATTYTNISGSVSAQRPLITQVNGTVGNSTLTVTAANHGLSSGAKIQIYISGISASIDTSTTVINNWYTVNVINSNTLSFNVGSPITYVSTGSFPYSPPSGQAYVDIFYYRFSSPFVPDNVKNYNSKFGSIPLVYVGFLVNSKECTPGKDIYGNPYPSNTCSPFIYRHDPVRLHQLPVLDFNGLATSYCPEDPAVILTGNQQDGTFIGNGITDLGVNNNTGSFDPGGAPTSATSSIEYQFTDDNGCVSSAIKNTFISAPISAPVVNDTAYCQYDSPPVTVHANGSALYEFLWYSDIGLTTQVGSGPDFVTPINPNISGNTQYYVIQRSGSGCTSPSDLVTVTIRQAPVPAFTLPPPCEDRVLTFSGPAGMTAWSWTFGDGGSGTGKDTVHTYQDQGSRTIVLTVTDSLGCTGSNSEQLNVGPNPKPTFTYDQTCDNDFTQFHGTDPTGNTSDFKWDFSDGTRTDSSATYNNYAHQFSDVGSYLVTLIGYSSSKCYDSIQRQVSILEYIQTIDPENPYIMADLTGANTGDGYWEVEDAGDSTTWEFNVATKDTIKSTDPVWVTNATKTINNGYYKANDRSFVNSPCMNLTNLTRPVFSLDYIMQTKFTNLDGAALEYSVDGGISWHPVRNTDPGTGADLDVGIDWFTTQGFSSSVGDNSLYGWSGDLWNGVGSNITWLSGKHKLDFITPKNKVRFRLAFGSDAAAGTEFEGFAFSNVKVESRNRLLLIENFTNQNKTAANGVSYAQNKTDYDNVTQLESVKMQYHLNYPAEDINSIINTADQTARSAYYGIVLTDANIPRTYIDGVSGGDITGTWADVRRGRRELIPSPIELKIKSEAAEVGYLKARVAIKALVDIPDAVINLPKFKNMVVRMAVVEKTDQNSNQFVFRDFISSPIGISLYDSLPKVQGDSIVVMDSILIEDLSILATNLTDLSLVAYVQDDSTREVYQSAIELSPVFTINPVTSIEDPEYADKINLYPNPANNLVDIQLPNVVVRNTPIVLFDAFGRSVYQNTFVPGERSKTVNTSNLTGGIYIVQIGTPEGGVARRKVMVVH